jgi:hypothetical protein
MEGNTTNNINKHYKDDKEKDITKIYLQPKKNIHSRVGTSFQAVIPNLENYGNVNINNTNYVIHENVKLTIEEEIESLKPQSKKRRIEY